MPAAKPARPDATLAALYKAVLASPDDDLPRLVYADRLEELGQPARAEFIRLQCHVAATKPWDEGHADALVRSEVLYEKHQEAWGIADLTRDLMRSKGVTPGVFNPFVRGFPEVMWANIETFSAAHRKALKKYPIRELVLVGGQRGSAVQIINEV
ncbi:MAG: TIGR02996 domain-containing protein, partial [Armatimonadaceae bacterium]